VVVIHNASVFDSNGFDGDGGGSGDNGTMTTAEVSSVLLAEFCGSIIVVTIPER
jgi:hypothetical protein